MADDDAPSEPPLLRFNDVTVVRVGIDRMTGERRVWRRVLEDDTVISMPVEDAIAQGLVEVVTEASPLEERGEDEPPLINPP